MCGKHPAAVRGPDRRLVGNERERPTIFDSEAIGARNLFRGKSVGASHANPGSNHGKGIEVDPKRCQASDAQTQGGNAQEREKREDRQKEKASNRHRSVGGSRQRQESPGEEGVVATVRVLGIYFADKLFRVAASAARKLWFPPRMVAIPSRWRLPRFGWLILSALFVNHRGSCALLIYLLFSMHG